jgi:hypothetical protein
MSIIINGKRSFGLKSKELASQWTDVLHLPHQERVSHERIYASAYAVLQVMGNA